MYVCTYKAVRNLMNGQQFISFHTKIFSYSVCPMHEALNKLAKVLPVKALCMLYSLKFSSSNMCAIQHITSSKWHLLIIYCIKYIVSYVMHMCVHSYRLDIICTYMHNLFKMRVNIYHMSMCVNVLIVFRMGRSKGSTVL